MGLRLNTGDTGNYVTSADDGSLYAGIYGKGCYVTQVGSKFAATLISNTEIRIADGDAIINGRHCMLNPNEYETIAIAPGATGYNRTDLIGIQYTNDNGTESAEMTVIQGTSSQEAPEPEYDDGDILAGATSKFFPLWRVGIRGINIWAIQPMFTVVPSLSTMTKADIGLGNVDNTADENKSVNHAESANSANKANMLNQAVEITVQGACIRRGISFNGSAGITLPINIRTASDTVDVITDPEGRSITCKLTRIGPMVFLQASGRIRLTSGVMQSVPIPAIYRPKDAQVIGIIPLNYSNSEIASTPARIQYATSGEVTLKGITNTSAFYSHTAAWIAADELWDWEGNL